MAWRKIGLLSSRSRSQQGLIWSKYDSALLSEMLFLWQPNLVWWYIIIRQMACVKSWITAFKVKVTVKVHNVYECLSILYFLNHQTFCHKDWLAVFKVKVTAGAHMIRMQQFHYIFWTADPFATRLGLMVHYYKPEYLLKKLDCCVQDQGHSKSSKCQWMFVQMIPSELLNLLLPNLVWWYIIMNQSVCYKKRFFCCLHCQSHSEG